MTTIRIQRPPSARSIALPIVFDAVSGETLSRAIWINCGPRAFFESPGRGGGGGGRNIASGAGCPAAGQAPVEFPCP
ncbi:MAG: hypothetical protein LBV65_01350 [Desulfovibrio sp.]|nr:hypothetical protein [Desulfovibrio sp.]